MADPISIKGTRQGLTITLGDGEMNVLKGDLASHLKMQGAFFRGARVALKTGDRSLSAEDLNNIQAILAQHDMILRTLVSGDAATKASAEAIGLRIAQPEAPSKPTEAQRPRPRVRQAKSPIEPPAPLGGTKGIMVKHVVRSGQILRHTGHIVIIGDVNPGATVNAGGDIVVWGRLMGMAHAGSLGDQGAMVCALHMSPMQLRVGSVIARPQEEDMEQPLEPEIAYVQDGTIVVQPWHQNKSRGV